MHVAKCLRWCFVGLCVSVALYGLMDYDIFNSSKTTNSVWQSNQDVLSYQHGDSSNENDTDRKLHAYQRQYIQKGDPVNHIAFLKIHKAASTTIANIFLRYGIERNLVFALPRGKGGGGPSLTSRYFFPPPRNETYDISCGHVRYNRDEFSRVLPNDTMYIEVVREPFSLFQSFINCFYPKNVLDIPGNNPVLDYLSHTEHHIKYQGYIDLQQMAHEFNMMAIEFGFPEELFWDRNQTKIQSYLRKLDKEMNIVLVVEYFDESIVLMRRLLNWDLKDILYCKTHVRGYKRKTKSRLQFGSKEEKLYKERSYLDYALYDFFLHKMKEILKHQPPDFYEEVAYFRKTRIKTEQFCKSTTTDYQNMNEVLFEGSKWNKPFVINKRFYEHVFESAALTFKTLINKTTSPN
ncbi:galactose-3-O-sulfotransferase 2-like [Mizuhopecten yessoensis]|uniref:Galactose-3-O-sulfotransferase 3 n=1 Tax=Mizuhopecten yessoensis TaxID=6573 RepID=A0A210QJ11_MIZYE|nr:galactose-3-O-sulfotransferase 2-like [Mizuhopecten yessoensis]OWF48730.1 Galactose-3-O-sulfotransferase 3 [Mizuhopecten yessoensis]